MTTRELLSPSQRRWFGYRPRWLLAFISLAAILGSWFVVRMEKAWRQEKEVLAIRRIAGCQVAYDGGDVFETKDFFARPLPLPPVTWTESLFGRDFVHRAGTVGFPADRVGEIVPHLKQLPYLRRVVVLKAEDGRKDQVEAAARKIEQELLGVESVLLELDFNIEPDIAARERD